MNAVCLGLSIPTWGLPIEGGESLSYSFRDLERNCNGGTCIWSCFKIWKGRVLLHCRLCFRFCTMLGFVAVRILGCLASFFSLKFQVMHFEMSYLRCKIVLRTQHSLRNQPLKLMCLFSYLWFRFSTVYNARTWERNVCELILIFWSS